MAYTNKIFRWGSFSFWFWILLVYVIAALVWWFVSLERQNHEMARLKLSELKKTIRNTYSNQLLCYPNEKETVPNIFPKASRF